MSAAETRAVIDRLGVVRTELGAKDFGAYAFLALGILADQAPEVLTFILDRTDGLLGERLMNDTDTLTLVAQAITECATNPHDTILGHWLTSIATRGPGVADVDRDYAVVIARTYLYGTP